MNPPASTTKPGHLGTIQDAADRCASSRQSIRRMIAQGILTGYRIPGTRSIRVDLDELEAKLQRVPTVGDVA